MTTEVTGRRIAGLAFPALGVLAAEPIYLLLDTAVVGHVSAEALAAVKQAGFADAVHLQGGILAWAAQMQPDMVVY